MVNTKELKAAIVRAGYTQEDVAKKSVFLHTLLG